MKLPEIGSSPASLLESFNGHEVLSQSDKQMLFAAPVAEMSRIANPHGLFLPPNLLSQLLIVDNQTYTNIMKEKGLDIDDGEEGCTIPEDRISLLNADVIQQHTSYTNDTFENIVVDAGVHELWHTQEQIVMYQGSNFVSSNQRPSFRQQGLRISSPDVQLPISLINYSPFSNGTSRLREGFIQYLTHTTRNRLSIPCKSPAYAPETLFVMELIRFVGEEPFFKGAFSSNGINALDSALSKTFGPDGLERIATRAHKLPFQIKTGFAAQLQDVLKSS